MAHIFSRCGTSMKTQESRTGDLLSFTHPFGCLKNLSLLDWMLKTKARIFWGSYNNLHTLKLSLHCLTIKAKNMRSILLMLMIHMKREGTLKTTHTKTPTVLWGGTLSYCCMHYKCTLYCSCCSGGAKIQIFLDLVTTIILRTFVSSQRCESNDTCDFYVLKRVL